MKTTKHKLHTTPPWELRIRRACAIALQNHPDWHLVSVSPSTKSDSKYLYLYHNGQLFPIRLSNHFNYERNYRLYTRIEHDENTTVEDLAGSLQQLIVGNDYPSLQFCLKDYLILQLVATAQLTHDNSRIYIDNMGSLVIKKITHQEFYLQGGNIEKIVQKLRSIHVGSNTGHIFLSNNGLDFLHAYGALRKEEWPAKISNFDTNMVLQNLALCGILVIKRERKIFCVNSET